jgi:hypothetical protein
LSRDERMLSSMACPQWLHVTYHAQQNGATCLGASCDSRRLYNSELIRTAAYWQPIRCSERPGWAGCCPTSRSGLDVRTELLGYAAEPAQLTLSGRS